MTYKQTDYGYEGLTLSDSFTYEEELELETVSYDGVLTVSIVKYYPNAKNGFGCPLEAALIKIVFSKGQFRKEWYAKATYRVHFSDWDNQWASEILAYLCDDREEPIKNRNSLQFFFDYSTKEEGITWEYILDGFFEDRGHIINH